MPNPKSLIEVYTGQSEHDILSVILTMAQSVKLIFPGCTKFNDPQILFFLASPFSV